MLVVPIGADINLRSIDFMFGKTRCIPNIMVLRVRSRSPLIKCTVGSAVEVELYIFKSFRRERRFWRFEVVQSKELGLNDIGLRVDEKSIVGLRQTDVVPQPTHAGVAKMFAF